MDSETYQSWLAFYKKAHAIKNPVKYLHDQDKKKRLPLSDGVFEAFIQDINRLLCKCSFYLDQNNVKMTRPKWIYDINDTKTWKSSIDFKYKNLSQ